MEKRFEVNGVFYMLRPMKTPTHKWVLFRQNGKGMGFEAVQRNMSKAEAERMYKLLKG